MLEEPVDQAYVVEVMVSARQRLTGLRNHIEAYDAAIDGGVFVMRGHFAEGALQHARLYIIAVLTPAGHLDYP